MGRRADEEPIPFDSRKTTLIVSDPGRIGGDLHMMCESTFAEGIGARVGK